MQFFLCASLSTCMTIVYLQINIVVVKQWQQYTLYIPLFSWFNWFAVKYMIDLGFFCSKFVFSLLKKKTTCRFLRRLFRLRCNFKMFFVRKLIDSNATLVKFSMIVNYKIVFQKTSSVVWEISTWHFKDQFSLNLLHWILYFYVSSTKRKAGYRQIHDVNLNTRISSDSMITPTFLSP